MQSSLAYTQVAQRLHEKEAGISVDFATLPGDLQAARSPAEREAAEQKIQDKLRAIQAEIESIAPNMRAMERWFFFDHG